MSQIKTDPPLIALAPDGMKAPDAALPITVLEEPEQHPGDYLSTLHEWGDLPEIVPVPDVARLIAHLAHQNPAAIRKVLEWAIAKQEIAFFGLRASGEWEPGMIRIKVGYRGKPRVKETAGNLNISAVLDLAGPLYSEAMGLRIPDAVALLFKRGRKIPEALVHLLPPGATPTNKKPGRKPTTAPARLKEILDALEQYASASGYAFDRSAMPGPLGMNWQDEGSFHWLCASIDPVFKKAKATFENHRGGICAIQPYAKGTDFYRCALPHIAPKLGAT